MKGAAGERRFHGKGDPVGGVVGASMKGAAGERRFRADLSRGIALRMPQ